MNDEIIQFIVRGQDTRFSLRIADGPLFELSIESETTSENDNTVFETYNNLSFPVFETQRLGKILYYLFGTYQWDLMTMTAIPFGNNTDDIITTFFNEEYFKVKLYEGVERNLRQMRWIKSMQLTRLQPISEEQERYMNTKMDLHAFGRDFPFWRHGV